MPKAKPVNIAELFLLRAMVTRQVTGKAGNQLTTEAMAALNVSTNYLWKLFGDNGTRLRVLPTTYDKIVRELDGFEFHRYQDFAERYAGEPPIVRYRTKRFDEIEQYGDLSDLKLWAIAKADQLFDQLAPKAEQQLIDRDLTQLNSLYQQYHLTRGCLYANEAIKRFPKHPGIVRLWALFHNRTMNWKDVRDQLLPKLNDANEELNAVCRLAIFESYLNQFTKEKSPKAFQKLEKAKHEHLNRVPDKENNGHYHYFLARFIEEEWWMSPPAKRASARPQLIQAANSINHSIQLYQAGTSGYQALEKRPWWLLCHLCILLKLSGHKMFGQYLNDYGRLILDDLFKPVNLLKKSMQIYAVTYYLLCNDKSGLIIFLQKLDAQVELAISKTIMGSDPISEVDNFTYHHVDLLFAHDPDQWKEYYTILDNWFNQKIT